jgi:hypothetical protein
MQHRKWPYSDVDDRDCARTSPLAEVQRLAVELAKL